MLSSRPNNLRLLKVFSIRFIPFLIAFLFTSCDPVTVVIAKIGLKAIIILIILIIVLIILLIARRRGQKAANGEAIKKAIDGIVVIAPSGEKPLSPQAVKDIAELVARIVGKQDNCEFDPNVAEQIIQLIEDLLTKGLSTASPDDEQKLKDALEQLKKLKDELQEELKKKKLIDQAKDYFGKAAGNKDEQEKRDKELLTGVSTAGNVPNNVKIPALKTAAEDLQKKMKGKPICLNPPKDPCAIDSPISNLVFGDGDPIVLKPGCCIELTFSPKLRDHWGQNDLQVLADPKDSTMSVEGREGDKQPYKQLERDQKNQDEFEFPGLTLRIRTVKICNNGKSDLKLLRVQGKE